MGRKRSYWAWGWEDNMASPEARQRLAEILHASMHMEPGERREAVSMGEVKLRPSAFSKHFADTSAEARIRHTYGRSWPDLMRGYLGDYDAAPDGVVVVGSAKDVQRAFEWADQNNASVQIYGGGTSLVAGVESDKDRPTLCLDTSGMSGVIELDSTSQLARIGGGTFGPAIENSLRPYGLTLGHFPLSFEFSTLGGWIATRSKGRFAVVRPTIDQLLESAEMVTPSGILTTHSRLTGPDPNRIVCGSEGTLGVITEAWMRLRERPRFSARAAVFFQEWSGAVNAVRELSESGLCPTSCRLLDSREVLLNQVAFYATHILTIGFESFDCPQNVSIESALEISRAHGGVCPSGPLLSDGPKASDRWKSFLADIPYLQSALLTMGLFVETFETSVAWKDFEAFHDSLVRRLNEVLKEVCGGGFVTCRVVMDTAERVTSYFTWIAPIPVRDASSLAVWQQIKTVATGLVVELGGTKMDFFAVGRTRREHFHRVTSPLNLESLRATKRQLDPHGILNPGVLL